MRSKRIPTSTTSAKLAALFPPLASAADSKPPPSDAERPERRPASPPLGPGGPFVCAQCGGAYPTRDQLERHETLHSPNTQSCKQCHKSFANVYRLQRHMISHDESALLRKFKCNDCDKAFKFKHHLKEHLRIHSGEKPFECANCGKKFSHSGSYSSHMTSKKCLVMNLKMGRIKPTNPALNPDRSPSRKRNPGGSLVSQLNNNLPPNGSSFLPILPKYNDAAAAFLASMSPQDGGFHHPPNPLNSPSLHSLYMSPGMPLSPASGIAPYTLPASLGHLLEQIASSHYHQRKMESEIRFKENVHSDPEDLIEEVTEDDDKRSTVSSDHELVMDIDEDEAVAIKQERTERLERESQPTNQYPSPPSPRNSPSRNNNTNMGGLNMILESVNASVTKHLLQANMQKLSPVMGNTCPSFETESSPPVTIKPDPDENLNCSKCGATFNHKTELVQHEQVLCGKMFRKHEGLAAQVAETLALNRMEAERRDVIAHSGISASEDEEYIKEERDEKTQLQESDRKIRVRTAISEEQQTILKEHYSRNQRPNREEFKRIAQQLGLDNRVVQVWFQNNRARVRRMNQSSAYYDQPLDLSTKKYNPTILSTPSPSPPCSVSVVHSDSGEEAVNLSQKSSRSPTPYRVNYQPHYPHSNCSSSSFADFRHSPSPGEMFNSHKRLLQQKMLMNPNMQMLPMIYPNELMASRSPQLSGDLGRPTSSSPGSERRSWSEDHQGSHDTDIDDGGSAKKMRSKISTELKEGEGHFVCDQCDKTFVKQSSLARHKYEHSGQRPYKCLECPKAFKHKHHLTEHKRLHTGEKPFQCCKCLKNSPIPDPTVST